MLQSAKNERVCVNQRLHHVHNKVGAGAFVAEGRMTCQRLHKAEAGEGAAVLALSRNMTSELVAGPNVGPR